MNRNYTARLFIEVFFSLDKVLATNSAVWGWLPVDMSYSCYPLNASVTISQWKRKKRRPVQLQHPNTQQQFTVFSTGCQTVALLHMQLAMFSWSFPPRDVYPIMHCHFCPFLIIILHKHSFMLLCRIHVYTLCTGVCPLLILILNLDWVSQTRDGLLPTH